MSRVRIESFEQLAVEFASQLDGVSASIKSTKIVRVDIETTDSVIANIMPCSFPNPEQVLDSIESSLGREWDLDLSISESRSEFIRRMMDNAYA